MTKIMAPGFVRDETLPAIGCGWVLVIKRLNRIVFCFGNPYIFNPSGIVLGVDFTFRRSR